MKISSPAFENGKPIPKNFTCEGEDSSPELVFSDVPPESKSLALICDDPDAPAGTWVHWVVWNIDPKSSFPQGARGKGPEGTNDFKRTGYGGPCPPRGHGTHRYFFKLYALDTSLGLKAGSTKADLEKAMSGHVLASAELMGTYERE